MDETIKQGCRRCGGQCKKAVVLQDIKAYFLKCMLCGLLFAVLVSKTPMPLAKDDILEPDRGGPPRTYSIPYINLVMSGISDTSTASIASIAIEGGDFYIKT